MSFQLTTKVEHRVINYKYFKVALARIFRLFLFAIFQHCVNNAPSGLTSCEVSEFF